MTVAKGDVSFGPSLGKNATVLFPRLFWVCHEAPDQTRG